MKVGVNIGGRDLAKACVLVRHRGKVGVRLRVMVRLIVGLVLMFGFGFR